MNPASRLNDLVEFFNSANPNGASPDLVSEVEAGSSAVKQVFERGKKMIGKAAEFADKGSKIVKFSKEVYELGMNGWQFGQQLLSSLPG